MLSLGLDPGISRANPVGVALVRWPLGESSPVLLGTAQLAPLPREPLATFLGRLSYRLSLDWLQGVQLLGVEWSYVGENAQSALDLAACCGAALAAAGEAGITAHLVTPSQAKLALAGRGNADKPMMIDAVRQQFGRTVPKDQADAVGIALAALTLARRPAQLRLPTKRAKARKG